MVTFQPVSLNPPPQNRGNLWSLGPSLTNNVPKTLCPFSSPAFSSYTFISTSPFFFLMAAPAMSFKIKAPEAENSSTD